MKDTITPFNQSLFDFLDASPTPFHAVATMVKTLKAAGFIHLDEQTSWQLEQGNRYYVTRNGSSLIAFVYTGEDNYTMLGAHTDSPNLKLKPSPVVKGDGCVKLGLEPYGGLLMNPWFDRDLGLAGRAIFQSDDDTIHETLLDTGRPVAVIASLAIHLDKEANKERTVNAQQHLPALIGTDETFDFESWIKAISGMSADAQLLSHELSLYDTQPAKYVGVDNDFYISARLDNLLSCFVALKTITNVDDRPFLIVCSDHEEVGSGSTSGAAGPFLENTLQRISGEYESFVRLCRRSQMISCDNAHAIHPNYADKHDQKHAPHINKGAVVKINANQRYASNAPTISRFVQAAGQVNEPIQEYVTRSDMGCGSTIGPITATRLGIDTIDIGLPTLAMHSIRELAGAKDAFGLYKILTHLQTTS